MKPVKPIGRKNYGSIGHILESRLGEGDHHVAKGAVWRVERKRKVDFLAKYIRHDKIDGCYLDQDINLWNPDEE